MSYTIDRLLTGVTMNEVEARTRTALTDHSFGVLTEIDVQATMKKKIGKDMLGYKILGACNPDMAWGAIGLEPKIGSMLPCNVILREVDGGVEVSAVDPVASMAGVGNAELTNVAGDVRDMLAKVIAAI
ncbi:MAG: DUF302 domain-containing protein [Deltaproteobacteria bacterium]